MPRFLDLSGQRFERLTVLGPAVRRANRVYWPCRCDCGNELVIFAGSLRAGLTKSCGCLRAEKTAGRNRTHGMAARGRELPEYRIWNSMRNRCSDPTSAAYERYGGRGIAVCERWQSFANFIADMGRRPTPQHQIERIDNDGPYAPDNCRWATRSENCNNRSDNRVIEHEGRRMTLAEWARATGLRSHTIANRLDRLGWSAERALATPPRFDRRHHLK